MFLEPDHSMIDFATPTQAVLSQNSLEHLNNLCAAHRTSLYQADKQAHILQHQPIPPDRTALHSSRASCGAIPLAPGLCALAVQRLLLFLADRITIIGHTAHRGLLLAMSPPATKGTAQVFATAITWMSQEKDPAMPAADQASAYQGLGSEH
jgi:hypothetical protein